MLAIDTHVLVRLLARDDAKQAADTVTAALAHFQRKPALGFSDCLVLEIAKHAGHTPLGTFDNALAKLPGVHSVK
jgi:predicted nucleic acid-binding protein